MNSEHVKAKQNNISAKYKKNNFASLIYYLHKTFNNIYNTILKRPTSSPKHSVVSILKFILTRIPVLSGCV